MSQHAKPDVVTTATDVVELFCAAPAANSALETWRLDPYYAPRVVPHVERHVTRALYDLTPADVDNICRTTTHALGDVKRSDGESVKEIVNWNPAFAVTHVLHHYLETTGRVPRWEEFLHYCRHDDQGREMLGYPIREAKAEQITAGYPPRLVDASMHWRLGNFYYSFLRELWLVTRLRHAGLDMRVHPLADALFRVDAWFNHTALVVYIGNKNYRDGLQGRKVHAERLLRGADSAFRIREVYLTPATVFGRVHLPTKSALEEITRSLLGDNGKRSIDSP